MKNKKQNNLTHEVVLNAGGAALAILRVDNDTAKQIKASLEIPEGGIKFPIVVRKIGKQAFREELALHQATAPKLSLDNCEVMLLVKGMKGDGDITDKEVEEIEGSMGWRAKDIVAELNKHIPGLKWNYVFARPGTVLEGGEGE